MSIIIWAIALLVCVTFSSKVRKAIRPLLHVVLSYQFLILIIPFLLWVTILIFGASKAGIWNYQFTTDTFFWLIASGFVLFANMDDATEVCHFFGKRVKNLFQVTLLLEVIIQFSILSIFWELIIVFFVSIISLIKVHNASQKVEQILPRFIDHIVSIVGFSLVLFGSYRMIVNFSKLDITDMVLRILSPIWLTIGVLPFVFALAVYIRYELIYRFIDFESQVSRTKKLQIIAILVCEYKLQAKKLSNYNHLYTGDILEAKSRSELRKVVKQRRITSEQILTKERENIKRLKKFAGVDGFDEDGRRLDRREFAETCKDLRWLHTCHMGHWRHNQRYVTGLLDKISTSSGGPGISEDAGYKEVVAPDGSSWFAWRRTIGNWVFAIGASDPPPDQWLFDGPEPPQGTPGVDDIWGDSPFSDEFSLNWD